MMNKDKLARIDEFLNYVKQVVQDTSIDIDDYYTYYSIITDYNISEKEKAFDVDPYFNKWVFAFKDTRNIDVFVSQNWDYFCQFTNADKYFFNSIKIYVPLDSLHLYEGANMIFDYLSKHNITHISKIAKEIRNDDIVIRVTNKKDALDLLEFIKNNSYIQEGLLKQNPFTLNVGGVSITSDGEASFNDVLSYLITEYFKDKKEKDELDSVSAIDFFDFVYYYSKSINDEYFSIPRLESLRVSVSPEKRFADFKGILKIICNSCMYDFNFDKYFKIFEEMTSYKNFANDRSDITPSATENSNIFDNIKFTVDAMIEKYDFKVVVSSIKRFLETNDYLHITRNKGAREIWKNNSTLRDEVLDYIIQNGLLIDQFLYSFIPTKVKDYLEYACYITCLNYDIDFCTAALIQYIKYGNSTGFTRKEDARNKLTNNVSPKEAIYIITNELGIDKEEFLKSSNLELYCKEFLKKYVINKNISR